MPVDSCSGKRAVGSRLPKRLIDWLSNTKWSDLKPRIHKQQNWTLQVIFIYVYIYLTIRIKEGKAYQFESKGHGRVWKEERKGSNIIIFLLNILKIN